jgi:CBS domain-containing protein
MALRDLALTDASVPATATLAEAVAELFEARVPAVAVLDEDGSVLGILSERDVLRAVFPPYLAEIRHSAFLLDDEGALEALAAEAHSRPVGQYVRASEVLDASHSQVHAAERLMHSGDDALPVVEGGRFIGMLSVAAICHARLDRTRSKP